MTIAVRKQPLSMGEPDWPAVQIYNAPKNEVNWVECSGDLMYLRRLLEGNAVLNSRAKRDNAR